MSGSDGLKRRYVKPRMEEVRLEAGEAVLQGCKAENGEGVDPGWGVGGCGGSYPVMCQEAGS
jgi:hypothetical protein